MDEISKPNLYLDVDGVFFSSYPMDENDEPWFQPRPFIISFINWVVPRFNCKWLTCWLQEDLVGLPGAEWGFFILGYAHKALQIEYVDWRKVPARYQDTVYADKVDAIDVEHEDFYWLEDGIGERAENILKQYGKFDRYLHVSDKGADGLVTAKRWLEQKLLARTAARMSNG